MVVVQKYSGAIEALENLPSTLRETRRVRGLSMRAVASATGLNHSTIDRIEHGKDCHASHALIVMRWIEKA